MAGRGRFRASERNTGVDSRLTSEDACMNRSTTLLLIAVALAGYRLQQSSHDHRDGHDRMETTSLSACLRVIRAN